MRGSCTRSASQIAMTLSRRLVNTITRPLPPVSAPACSVGGCGRCERVMACMRARQQATRCTARCAAALQSSKGSKQQVRTAGQHAYREVLSQRGDQRSQLGVAAAAANHRLQRLAELLQERRRETGQVGGTQGGIAIECEALLPTSNGAVAGGRKGSEEECVRVCRGSGGAGPAAGREGSARPPINGSTTASSPLSLDARLQRGQRTAGRACRVLRTCCSVPV